MSTPAVEVVGLARRYGEREALSGVSLSLQQGETLVVFGPNGAGKTTLLRVLATLLRPHGGEVRVLGHRPWNNAPLMRYVGLCPEQDAFYEWMTGLDFVRTCAKLTGMSRGHAAAAADKAIATVGMTSG